MSSLYLKLEGGMGNQLFQIAAGYAHAKKYNKEFFISRDTTPGRFTHWSTICHQFEKNIVSSNITADNFPRPWREPHFHYTPIPHNSGSIYGYFQSSKYFADISSEIREKFDMPREIKDTINEKYREILESRDEKIYCVLHIRRTDYLNPGARDFHLVCDKAWYIRAMKMMIELYEIEDVNKITFLVFSDDLAWCTHSDQSDMWIDKNVKFIDEPIDHYTIYLMSQFNNFIISNSSFSWWAIYLSKSHSKKVIAPSRWFGPTGPQDFHDIYEPGWILL